MSGWDDETVDVRDAPEKGTTSLRCDDETVEVTDDVRPMVDVMGLLR